LSILILKTRKRNFVASKILITLSFQQQETITFQESRWIVTAL